MSAAATASIASREQIARIARLNDLARSAMGVACTAVATVGFRSLPEADQSRVCELIKTYDAFDEDNDPHGERDFGKIYQLTDGGWTTDRPRCRDDERERVFWKIDCHDESLTYASGGCRRPGDHAPRPDRHALR